MPSRAPVLSRTLRPTRPKATAPRKNEGDLAATACRHAGGESRPADRELFAGTGRWHHEQNGVSTRAQAVQGVPVASRGCWRGRLSDEDRYRPVQEPSAGGGAVASDGESVPYVRPAVLQVSRVEPHLSRCVRGSQRVQAVVRVQP